MKLTQRHWNKWQKIKRMNPWKPKTLCRPAQNFVKCSHLNVPPLICPQNCFAVFVGSASTFIICRPPNLGVLPICELIQVENHYFKIMVHKREGHFNLTLPCTLIKQGKSIKHTRSCLSGRLYASISSINHAVYVLRLRSVSTLCLRRGICKTFVLYISISWRTVCIPSPCMKNNYKSGFWVFGNFGRMDGLFSCKTWCLSCIASQSG